MRCRVSRNPDASASGPNVRAVACTAAVPVAAPLLPPPMLRGRQPLSRPRNQPQWLFAVRGFQDRYRQRKTVFASFSPLARELARKEVDTSSALQVRHCDQGYRKSPPDQSPAPAPHPPPPPDTAARRARPHQSARRRPIPLAAARYRSIPLAAARYRSQKHKTPSSRSKPRRSGGGPKH